MAVYHEGAYYDALLDYQNEIYMECTNSKYDIDKNKKKCIFYVFFHTLLKNMDAEIDFDSCI